MMEAERILPILDNWASGTGAKVYLYGSRVRGDFSAQSDADIFIEWPSPLTDTFCQWWTYENADLWRGITEAVGARVEVLDPDDKLMQTKILLAEIVATRGCAVAVNLPRAKS